MEQRILALGFFDGVHLGHGALLRACRTLADEFDCRAGAVTFSTHPDALVSGIAPRLINTSADRERILRTQYRMDDVIALPFDRAMMSMPYMTFFRMLLAKHNAAGMVCGHDFRFGFRGEGNAVLLRKACEDANIPCIVIPEQTLDSFTISSSHIRELLERGDVEQAARFLGHPHCFTGTVVPGKHLGSRLGFPTANLVLPQTLQCPRHGVYACRVRIGAQEYPAVTNVGIRPTVGGENVTVEPWILGYEGDLYGREITLEFHKFLRPEQKFESLADLQAEIRKNREEALKFFGNT